MPEKRSQKKPKRKCALLVDATNTFMRGYASNPSISDGVHVGGVLTFIFSLRNFIVKTLHTDSVVCVWDGVGGSIRRRSLYKEYKNGRRPKKKNRFHEHGQVSNSAEQQLMCINMMDCLPVRQLSVPGCEADDVIAFLTNKYVNDGWNVVIMSTDKDYYQLVSPHVVIFNAVLKKFIRQQDIITERGIHPRNWVIARAVDGDPSDNIKGVDGVGLKTLLKYFPYLSEERAIPLYELLSDIEKIEKPTKTILKISDGCDIIERNIKLMSLNAEYLTYQQKEEIVHCMNQPLALERNAFTGLVLKHKLTMHANNFFNSFVYLRIAQDHHKGING